MNIAFSNPADCDEGLDILPDDEIEAYDQEHGITRELIASCNSQPEGNNGALAYLTCVLMMVTDLTGFKVITSETIARKNHTKRTAEPTDMTTDAPSAKPARKRKKVEAQPADVSDPDHSPAIGFKTIWRVEKPPPPLASRQKSSKPSYLELEPFEFTTIGTFVEYLDAITHALPCPRNNLVTTGMLWKTEKPKTADPHPLTTDAGFKALIEKVSTQKVGDQMIILYMKPPMKPVVDERVSAYHRLHIKRITIMTS
jgi:hypothetical protein